MSNPYSDPNQSNPNQTTPPQQNSMPGPYQYPNQPPFTQYPSQPGFQPQPPTPPKKKRLPLVIGIIVAALVACGVFSLLSKGAAQIATPTTTTADATVTSGATTPAKTTSKPAAAPTWQTVQTFTGNGSKKTAVFSIGDTWKIKYSCQGMGSGVDGVLAVIVYDSNNTPIDLSAVNATCTDGKTTADETIEHTGGSVYLDINAASAWTVVVQEQK